MPARRASTRGAGQRRFDRLRRLISAGVPVLVETWLEHDGGMGHYRLVTGYDDTAGEWTVYDFYVSDGIDLKGPYPASASRTTRWIGCGTSSTACTWWSTMRHGQQPCKKSSAWNRTMPPCGSARWNKLRPSAADTRRRLRLVQPGQQPGRTGPLRRCRHRLRPGPVIGLPWRMLWYSSVLSGPTTRPAGSTSDAWPTPPLPR